MDHWQAVEFAAQIESRGAVGGWSIKGLINHGKSAVVLKAERGGKKAAIKVFHPSIVERFGKPAQKARIRRELVLRANPHPHVVKILDGGECPASGLLYVVMQRINARNLEDRLLDVPRNRIGPIIAQIAEAAQFLETLHIAHRDIKPSNIVVSPGFRRAILLDLGVLRPIGATGVTDDEKRPFLGTLQYAPPEFHDGVVVDSDEGWRAVTFYQLGGVLHDLIMKKTLFAEYLDPYPLLPKAVASIDPVINADDVPEPLVYLARCCLVKSWEDRLALVNWSDFRTGLPVLPEPGNEAETIRIVSRLRAAQQLPKRPSSAESVLAYSDEIRECLRDAVTEALDGQVPFRTSKSRRGDDSDASFGLSFRPSTYLGTNAEFELSVRSRLHNKVSRIVAVELGLMVDGVESKPQKVFFGPFDAVRIVSQLMPRIATHVKEMLEAQ